MAKTIMTLINKYRPEHGEEQQESTQKTLRAVVMGKDHCYSCL
jgi:hypothetical protein